MTDFIERAKKELMLQFHFSFFICTVYVSTCRDLGEVLEFLMMNHKLISAHTLFNYTIYGQFYQQTLDEL
jgi:hypothetical protein